MEMAKERTKWHLRIHNIANQNCLVQRKQGFHGLEFAQHRSRGIPTLADPLLHEVHVVRKCPHLMCIWVAWARLHAKAERHGTKQLLYLVLFLSSVDNSRRAIGYNIYGLILNGRGSTKHYLNLM